MGVCVIAELEYGTGYFLTLYPFPDNADLLIWENIWHLSVSDHKYIVYHPCKKVIEKIAYLNV